MEPLTAYILEGLDLRQRTILDAATGAGEATAFWAAEAAAQGGTSRIVSVDNDLSEEWRGRVIDRLGEHRDLVELREEDILEMRGIDDAGIDIVNCHDTLVFLATVPLRVLRALREFRRVLRPGGLLIVTSERATPVSPEGEAEGQWRRWALAKAIGELAGRTWSTEVAPGELENALVTLGFEVLGTREFPPQLVTSMEAVHEWRDLMEKEVAALSWSEALRAAIARTVERVAGEVLAEGKLLSPARFVTKARKPVRA